MTKKTSGRISFQGNPGAYSHSACKEAFPHLDPMPCLNFAAAFAAAENGKADYAMIPIDNSIAGRVADIHHLLPQSKLKIVAEHFLPVRHCLLGVKGARVADIKTVYSHVHALPQCRKVIAALKLNPVVYEDTAGSARRVAEMNDKSVAAIASADAAKLYGLRILRRNIEDETGNTTRFIVLARGATTPVRKKNTSYLTSLIFHVRHIPAALYKALGGFATNGLNITKVESYLSGTKFHTASFYAEVEAHPDDRAFQLALEELRFYAESVNIMGTYPCHPYRQKHL